MNIGILGTAMVGTVVGSALIEKGHRVRLGSRSKDNPKALDWVKGAGSNASQGSFEDAAAFGEVILNATNGNGSMNALQMAGADNLKNKILIDISNPLDFSKGMPGRLFICNDNSLAEEIQKAYPETRVVKALSTLTSLLMVNPKLLNEDHDIFLCGNDTQAKETVLGYLKSWFGWEKAIDLGDITASRAVEMYLPLWIRLWQKFQHPYFNLKFVIGKPPQN